jgi:hypothetical protein
MPAFAYTGMQYATIASYYFAQIRKKLLLLRDAARFRNIAPTEKPRKTGLSRQVSTVKEPAEVRNLPG